MGLLEPITHKEEIENLINEAQSTYDNAKKKFENQKEKTTKGLKTLGEIKVKAWADSMDFFVDNFSAFNNIEVVQTIDTNMDFVGGDEELKQMMINMQHASLTAKEVARAGITAVGTGVLVGIASYGGAMMFGTASTGTAIAALSGAAKATDDSIDNLLWTKYGTGDLLIVLSVLYPWADLKNNFHIDHIYPKSKFTTKKLAKKGIPEDKISYYIENVNYLGNLQLLEVTPNEEKNKGN